MKLFSGSSSSVSEEAGMSSEVKGIQAQAQPDDSRTEFGPSISINACVLSEREQTDIVYCGYTVCWKSKCIAGIS